MQFMLLLYANEKAGMALPKAEMDAWMGKMNAYAEALTKARRPDLWTLYEKTRR